jgi:hypothetical protein
VKGNFLRELKRRRVVRTLVVYVLVCWGILQVGDILFPAMGIDSDKASRLFFYLAIAGFPLTFALAWFFQITPEGIVKTTSFVERRVLQNIAPINDRRRADVKEYFNKPDSQSQFEWILSVEAGPLQGLSFGVNRGLVLGRSLDCDITVLSPHVSRHHARLELVDGDLCIEDLGSANGTLINGKRIEGRHALRHEDELRFQDIVFRVTESYSHRRKESATMTQTTLIPSDPATRGASQD